MANTTDILNETKDIIQQNVDQLTKFTGLDKKLKSAIPDTLEAMVKSLYEVDAALTQLKQTTNASESELSLYFDHAAESAQKYGRTIEETLKTTNELARQGFNLPDTKRLTDAISLYQNVGDNLSQASASQGLISTLKAYDLEAKNAESVVDKFNAVSNTYAISTSGINDALQRSATAFHEANTDLSKSLALIAGTDELVQNPAAVGDLWNTVAERIQFTKQELESAGKSTDGMLNTTSELRSMVQNLTGFDIMSDTAGTKVKDVYEIVVGIGSEWQKLSEAEQSGLLNAFAGSGQSDILAAAFNNVDKIKEIYQTAEFKSDGSAIQENEVHMDSLAGKTAQLKAQFDEFANVTLNSDMMKGLIDAGTSLLSIVTQLIDHFGSFGTLIGGISAGKGITNLVKNFDCSTF